MELGIHLLENEERCVQFLCRCYLCGSKGSTDQLKGHLPAFEEQALLGPGAGTNSEGVRSIMWNSDKSS